MINLTGLECEVLDALIEAHDADSGFLEDVKWKNRNQLGGVVSHLLWKGVITSIEKDDDRALTSFILHPDFRKDHD